MADDGFPFKRAYDGPIWTIGEAPGHHCYLYFEGAKEYRARCECDATWVYPAEATQQRMISIYESHLRYFNKPKMETL